MTLEKGERIETWFLIPILRDSDKQPHRVTLYTALRRELYDVAGGISGPTTVVIENIELVPGSWQDPETGLPSGDESRKYTVIIARSTVPLLEEVLARAANSFDQKEILFVVQGIDRSVRKDPAKGFLREDPAGG